MSEKKDKKKDARETYDFDKDVKYKREQFAKDDLIDTPYNKAKRYKIKSEGVKPADPEELIEHLHKEHVNVLNEEHEENNEAKTQEVVPDESVEK